MKWLREKKVQKKYDTMTGYAIWKKNYWPPNENMLLIFKRKNNIDKLLCGHKAMQSHAHGWKYLNNWPTCD
jgi:hypothetical protein